MSVEAVMRLTLRTCAALAAIGLTTPLAAQAAEGQKQHDHGAQMPKSMAELMSMSPEQCMRMMDTKNAGFVTKEEFMKFQEQLWKNMDKNRDNKADASEWGGKAAPGGG
jgi:hypothetical protein